MGFMELILGKNNRQRRKEKQARLKKKKEERKKLKKPTFNDFNVQLLENPFSNVSENDRKTIINEIQKVNTIDYKESLEKLQSLLQKYNPIVILSYLANYGLTAGVGEKGIKEYSREITQAHVEICQALILQIDIENLEFETPNPEVMQNIIDLLEKLMWSIQFKDRDSSILDLPKEDVNIRKVRDFVITHSQFVRNWGNFNQVKNISNEIYSRFDDLLLKTYNFTSSNVIEFFNYLVDVTENKNTKTFNLFREVKNIKNISDMVYKYHELVGQNKSEADDLIKWINKNKILDYEEVFMLLYQYHTDQYLPKNYIFNYREIAKGMKLDENILLSILDTFSYTFSDFKEYKTEYIFLSNPIWTKPIILLSEEEFFCPMPQLFFSFILKSFDNLLEQIDKNKLYDGKAGYLEDKIEKIVKSKFPSENTIRGIKWYGVGKEKEKEFETDLITFIDTYIIIFEAKSGKIDDSSLRGAPKRLKRDIENLLISPNIQSKRLKEKIEYLIKNPNIDDELKDKLPIDLNKIDKVLRVSITLEYFASLQSNIYELKDTGWIPDDYSSCPTMSIADFETVFDIFDKPTQIINYLEVREEIEEKIKYKGDELDLIAVYMENHLNLVEVNPNLSLMIKGMSKKLDDYYQMKDHYPDIERPKPR